MGRIRILSDNVANKIAAGEVVERPASVVKELLENSLDAGATEFRLDVESGGRRLIRLADNGCGMIRDDALLAFERHATSKLSDVKDLLSIATLGFRGEALPSIASVSRLLLETRSADERTGTAVEIAGGKILRCDELALPPGTTVTVRDLFYNVPARKKFLRSDQTEIAHIASLATHYSLAHPQKSFLLRHNNTELLSVTPVATLRERVFQVFGSLIVEDLVDLGDQGRDLKLPLDAEDSIERHFRLRGFVSGPQVQKLNRNSIYLFVNGRLIRDRLMLHAISSAYHNLIPPACYPFALLFLDCDAEEVDVNVHPSKTEVRFRHGSVVHDFLRDTIREILMARRPASNIPLPTPAQPSPQLGAALPYSEFSQRIQDMTFPANPSMIPEPRMIPEPAAIPEAGDLPEFSLHRPPSPAPRFDFSEPAAAAQTSVPDTHGPLFPGAYIPEPESLEALKDLRPLGQIHDSFIVAAGRDGLWIIDQHVAHERILFEKVLAARASGGMESQRLLVPLVIALSAAQQIEYARIADELNSLGFETEPFGQRTIAVKSAPAEVGAGDVEKILFEILEISERELRRASLDELRRAMAASIACRAAIKINMRLEPAKIDWLLRELAATSCPMSCPHGRPIALRYSTRDILKSFHRI
ncbi:MAG TPA: DNA mismatch repair endonuclease MutL [Bryobacteraceae bacterium]|nr:DNA mismatch repair endonuclease MutL [Bryobacteraceae bacterium]